MRDSKANRQMDRLLIQQASEWLEVLQRDDPGDREAFTNWLLDSPRQVRAYLFMTMLDEELAHIDPQHQIPLPDIRANVTTFDTARSDSQERRDSPSRRRFLAAAAVAFMFVLTVVGTILWQYELFGSHGWEEFATITGEQSAVKLTDGSIIHLNTQSRVRVRLTEEIREIRLLDGEALFSVRRDSTRPFVVHTSDATIRALGTQFNVHAVQGTTKVAVLEGTVRVRSASADSIKPLLPGATASAPEADGEVILSTGEEAEVRKDGTIEWKTASDVASRAAWLQRRLVFRQESLANVVAEFNRYREARFRFRVDDAELAARKYSGVFSVDDPKALEQLLASEDDITLTKIGDETVIRKRSAEAAER